MVLEGRLKTRPGRALDGKTYRFDLGLDSVYVRLRDGETAYSDYVVLSDTGVFKDHYAIVDYDQNKRAIGFMVEGLLDDLRQSSWKHRLMIDFGGLALQVVSRRVKDKVQDYLKDLVLSVDSRGRLVPSLSPAYA